jgi:hypothetical protein
MMIFHHKPRGDSINNLVVMAGFSGTSCCNTLKRINAGKEKLSEYFGNIYVINLAPFKDTQTAVCKYKNDNYDRTEEIFNGENNLNKEIGIIIDDLIVNKLKLEKVHLMGKCAGGAIAINTVIQGNYPALFLAVPGNPQGVAELLKIKTKDMIFIFGWNNEDKFRFKWGKESHEEKEEYDRMMQDIDCLEYNEYKSFMYAGDFHDVHPDLLVDIVNSMTTYELSRLDETTELSALETTSEE